MRRSEINDHLRGAEYSLDYLKDSAWTAHKQLQSWARSGFPSNTGMDKIRSSGSGDSPVEVAALNPDEPSRKAARLAKCVKQANQLLAEAASLSRMTLTPPEKKERVNQVPECLNCGEPCVPRAKKGRCPACYEYLRRTNKERPGNA
jgi:rubrerythrin